MKGLRLKRVKGYYDEMVDVEVSAALDEALRVFQHLGATLATSLPTDMAPLNALMHVIMSVEAATLHRRWLAERPLDYADQVRGRIEPGLYYPATRYVEALALRGPMTREWMDSAIGDADCAIIPTLPIPVPTIDETTLGSADDVADRIGLVTRHTRALNYLGLPVVAVPCGLSRSGLPISFMLTGRPWSEPLLLRIADAFQRATDWHERIPPHLE